MLTLFLPRCQVVEQMEKGLATGRDVAAMIIEPIQAEGGDNHASPYFFHHMQTGTSHDIEVLM